MTAIPFWTLSSLLAVLLALVLRFIVPVRFSAPPPRSAVFITGTSSGIGRHASVFLAQQGYRVFAGVRSAAAADELREIDDNLSPVICDVTDDSSVASAVDEIASTLGYLDEGSANIPFMGIVNNAGISGSLHAAEEGQADKALRIFDVNVFGLLRVSEAFLPLLRFSEPPGRIVNIGSVAGVVYRGGDVAYTGSKHAMEGITDVQRVDLRRFGISVSLIEPGFVQSEMCRAAICRSHPNITTTPAIVDALTSEWPKTRYAVADVHGIPAWVATTLRGLLPDRLCDYILSLFGAA